jgi:hypothetical protein
MTSTTRLRASSLRAVLASTLLLLALSPSVALATAEPTCEPAVHADGVGLRDAHGRLREPLPTEAPTELPKSQQGKGGGGFSATIPVYFHVVTNGTEGFVSLVTIDAQMRVLGRGYNGAYGGADTGFDYTLAGVDYTDNAAWFAAGPGSKDEADMKIALKRGGPGDMNVYTTSGNVYLGWAYYPSIVGTSKEYLDGVVLDYRSLPGGPYGDAYSLGGTLTHESGHWFGLAHTFEGGCGKGDLVEDTPAERTPTSGCPEGKDTCTSKPGLDPIHNYMDYSYDSCYTQFTPGQAQRAQDQYLAFRI